MDGLIPAIEKRRAYRALSEREISEEVVERIVTAGTYAPSCFNNQPWRLVVINEEAARTKAREGLSKANGWAFKAPMYVLIVTKPDLDCRPKDGREYAFYDAGLAAMNMMLQATEEGLIAHPIAGYKPAVMQEAFGIPEGFTVINVIVFGYPGDPAELDEQKRESEQAPRSRKPMEEVVAYNRWNFKEE